MQFLFSVHLTLGSIPELFDCSVRFCKRNCSYQLMFSKKDVFLKIVPENIGSMYTLSWLIIRIMWQVLTEVREVFKVIC